MRCINILINGWKRNQQTSYDSYVTVMYYVDNLFICCLKNKTLILVFLLHLSLSALIFTALHGMQSRYSDGNSVCLSVCLSVRLSVCQTRALWQNGRKICPDFYTMRKIILSSFIRRRMVGGGDPFYLKFWVNRPALERNRRFWTDNRS